MPENEWLVQQFEAYRTHLQRVAYRFLGSQSEADDAVQESWLRLNRSNTSDVENLRGWLTTVVARICLDILRSRKSRREESLDAEASELIKSREDEYDPEHEALLTDSVGLALLVVLDSLNPEERIAFVLHDMFDIPFVEIAPIVDRSPTATRQLASRARRRVRRVGTDPDAVISHQREIVGAFLAASRAGNFDALLALLDPDATFRAGPAIVAAWSVAANVGAAGGVHGAQAIAEFFKGNAKGAQLALVNGAVGVIYAPGGKLRGVFSFKIRDSKIVEIDVLGDPVSMGKLEITILDD
jgi:RNA polymerase sigma factor (sigma-70 family)